MRAEKRAILLQEVEAQAQLRNDPASKSTEAQTHNCHTILVIASIDVPQKMERVLPECPRVGNEEQTSGIPAPWIDPSLWAYGCSDYFGEQLLGAGLLHARIFI